MFHELNFCLKIVGRKRFPDFFFNKENYCHNVKMTSQRENPNLINKAQNVCVCACVLGWGKKEGEVI